MEISKIRKILSYENSKKEFFGILEHSKAEPMSKKIEKKLSAEKEDEFTPSRTVFNNVLDLEKANSDAENPEKLIRRALTNLENVPINHVGLKKNTVIEMLDKISQILSKLQK